MAEKPPARALLVSPPPSFRCWPRPRSGCPGGGKTASIGRPRRSPGVAARIVPGTLADAAAKVDPGVDDRGASSSASGSRSISVATEGKDSRREIWTYYFADGTLTLNVTDGLVQRVSAIFAPPKIPTSARPE